MNIHKWFIFILLLNVTMHIVSIHDHQNIDSMADFSYPLSQGENLRYQISQALCFLQEAIIFQDVSHYEKVIQALEQAHNVICTRSQMDSDEREFLENLLDHLNALIDKLEDESYRLHIMQDFENIRSQI